MVVCCLKYVEQVIHTTDNLVKIFTKWDLGLKWSHNGINCTLIFPDFRKINFVKTLVQKLWTFNRWLLKKMFTSGNRLGHSAIWRARLTDAGKFGASPIVMLLK